VLPRQYVARKKKTKERKKKKKRKKEKKRKKKEKEIYTVITCKEKSTLL